MARKSRLFSHCQKPECLNKIPDTKRSDAKYCSVQCRNAEEKKRYKENNPDYVERQKKVVRKWHRKKSKDPEYREKTRRRLNEYRHRETYGTIEYLENPLKNKKDPFRVARSIGFRSGLEVKVAKQLEELGIPYEYETMKIAWHDPRVKTYRPDYVLPNGIIIETKGRFTLEDRNKHIFIKAQHPELDIRFVFTNPRSKLRKGAKSSYADWCEKHGFLYAAKLIPKEWIEE